MGLVKSLIDGLNHAEIDVPDRRATVTDVGVVGVHLHYKLAFIERGATRNRPTRPGLLGTAIRWAAPRDKGQPRTRPARPFDTANGR